MKKLLILILFISYIIKGWEQTPLSAPQVKTANGIVEGKRENSGIYSFKGVAFAAAPIGNLRWKEPQPVSNWEGIRQAKKFGPRAMQPPIFGDMSFRSDGMSEDCLYLNVWSPNLKGKLPVLVYFYGGGFVAGDGSEGRYDGEKMANKGIVSLTVNYRLGVFGLLAHPELTQESPHHSSGNYGLMDQSAALQWVKQNIAFFGGDPDHITIAGESAGSVSVSAQMASPLSKNLIYAAIGESGSLLGTLPPSSLEKGEQNGMAFMKTTGANSLADLRSLTADSILHAATNYGPFKFSMTIDGYFLPKDPVAIFKSGEQAHVPLLVGWNSEENNFHSIIGNDEPTIANYEKAVRRIYGDKANDILKAYHASNDQEVQQVATDLASDRFIAFSTWRWADLQAQTGGKEVFRYFYTRPRPEMRAEMGNVRAGLAGGVIKNTSPTKASLPAGASHSAEIEYAMGNLHYNKVYSWKPEDYKVSHILYEYFANFIKKGNPNGKGLPFWPAMNTNGPAKFMQIDVITKAKTEEHRDRYLLMEENSHK